MHVMWSRPRESRENYGDHAVEATFRFLGPRILWHDAMLVALQISPEFRAGDYWTGLLDYWTIGLLGLLYLYVSYYILGVDTRS
jgi:hypothetical protein